MVYYYAALGIWGLLLAVLRRPVDGNYRGALTIAVGLGVVQALVGVVLLVMGFGPAGGYVHFLYGITAIFTLPIVRQYAVDRWAHVSAPLVFGLACFFLMGAAIRGITTGA